jgi:hypothetical protein
LEISSPTSTSITVGRAGQRQCHQQRRQELARHVAAHADRRRIADRRRMDAQRRETLVASVVDVGAELRSASTRSPIGRSCMRGTPDSR